MPLSVNQLNGFNGYRVAVAATGLSLTGDFNDDGFADLAIGHVQGNPGGRGSAGEVYVILGHSGSFSSQPIVTSQITGANGFVINGITAGDGIGWSIAYADLNHDGIDDIAIGAPSVTVNGVANAGAVYVVYGSLTTPATSFELSALNGINGFTLAGDSSTPSNRAGWSLSAAGDFNQDSIDDLFIGSPFPGSMFGNEHSHAYVLFGAASFPAATSLTAVTGTAGITYTGTFQDQLGFDVTNVGDVNGDGRPDLLYTRYLEASVGITNQPTYGTLVFGPPGAAVDAPVSWQISDEGPTNAVSGAGDFNGDGIDDFIVTLHKSEAFAYGRNGSDGVRINAAAVVVYGRTGGWEGVSNGLNSSKGFVLLSPDLSYTVSSAGDWNGDGLDDVVVSAGNSAYIVFGSNTVRADIDLRNMSLTQGLEITDINSPVTAASSGDVNNDGFSDVVIAAGTGTFVIFGKSTGTGGATQGPDTLQGTNGTDNIQGLGGDDILYGRDGDDVLQGNGGNDFLIGGGGVDELYGGTGDDNYYIIDPGDVNDGIHELAGEGRDRIATAFTYTLPANASIEVLEAVNSTSTNAMDLTGNALDNLIAGNNGINTISGLDGNDELAGYAGNDTLNGGDGNDVLIGGIGNDTMSGGNGSDKYYVQDVGDVIVEPVAPGDDTLATNVSYTLASGVDIEYFEPITFNSTATLTLIGNEFGTWLRGNNGDNFLDGKGGGDTLEGLGGADTYGFTTALGGTNVDLVAGFVSGTDRIVLDHNVFAGMNLGAVPAGAFVTGTAAGDADDRIIYDAATGNLFFDADGNGAGAAVLFATLIGHPLLVASDLTVF